MDQELSENVENQQVMEGGTIHTTNTASTSIHVIHLGDMTAEQQEDRMGKTQGQSVWKSVKKAGLEFNHDARRILRYFGRKLHRRRRRETKVKDIYITPGENDDDRMWATRMAGSANSRSSSGSDPPT